LEVWKTPLGLKARIKELNIIIKADVDGSVEALNDAMMKLSTDEIAVNLIHSGVGQITESDVLLASASDAIIIGFQVRPSAKAKQLAENEEIDIRTYSIIYQAIEEIKKAMEGMLSPDIIEKIIGQVEIREVFKITKVGTVAGCYVTDGKIERNSMVRVIRNGVVKHDGKLASLKRFKDDQREVTKGYECGLQLDKFNEILEGDYLEVYVQEEVKRKL
jgi:translation initiation factor IF-2